MNYGTERIAHALKEARKRKGLSQRALSALAGVPQPHISKIEANAVDLRVSSLAAIAHALDLEVVLVPRKALPAVRSVSASATGVATQHAVGRTGGVPEDPSPARPAYRLEDDDHG